MDDVRHTSTGDDSTPTIESTDDTATSASSPDSNDSNEFIIPAVPEDDDLDLHTFSVDDSLASNNNNTSAGNESTPTNESKDNNNNNSNRNNSYNNSCNDAVEEHTTIFTDDDEDEAPTTCNNPTSEPLCNKKGQAIHPFFLSQDSNTTVRPADGRKSTTSGMPPATLPIQTPPTIANPYKNSDRTNARAANGSTMTSGAEGGSSNTTPLIPQANVPPIPLPCSVPKELSEEEIIADDPKVQQITAADRKLISLYGDTIHQNDGCHLHGGIDPDISTQHQEWWLQVISTHLFLWDLPNGKFGNDFLDILNGLFKDVLARKHNMEMPLLFIACILHKQRGVIGYPKIKAIIAIRLALWTQGKIDMLVQSVLDAYDANGPGGRGASQDLESKERAYQSLVDKGQISKAVRNLTNRHKGGLLRPGDIDAKSGEIVITVLQQKHPNARIPDEVEFDEYEAAQVARATPSRYSSLKKMLKPLLPAYQEDQGHQADLMETP